eukprot:365313-Chlamydomonas_euryale.AAC.34
MAWHTSRGSCMRIDPDCFRARAGTTSTTRRIIDGWGRGDQVGAGSNSSGGTRAGRQPASKSSPRVVLRDGMWVLDGYDSDLEELDAGTADLQARLLGGIKAEQARPVD